MDINTNGVIVFIGTMTIVLFLCLFIIANGPASQKENDPILVLEKDGCKIYKFWETQQGWHFFSRCEGAISSNVTGRRQIGKTTVPTELPTEYK